VQPYSAEVAAIAAAGTNLQRQAEAFVITTDNDDLDAKTMLAQVRKGLKRAEDRRKEVKAPHLAMCNEIDAAFKTALAPWSAADKAIATKAGAYHKAKIEAEQAALRERERAEREAAEAARRAAGPMMVDGQPLPPAPPVELLPAPAPVVATTKTAAGDVGMARHRGFQIVDEAQIPREYLVVDRVKLGKAYRDGLDVPGCKEDVTYVPRTR
jgi:hypothetical protein